MCFRKYDDPSAKRYIMSFSVGEPFLCSDLEFVSLKVEGQSFMLHQIRKMIGRVLFVISLTVCYMFLLLYFKSVHNVTIIRGPSVIAL